MTTLANSGQEGAASAAPSPTSPEDAERLLNAATSPAQAWAIYEISSDREGNWRIVKLKAERRYGELLGPPEPGNPGGKLNVSGTNVSGADRVARTQARKVAAVPQAKFDAYIEEHDAKSTRAGLLKFAGVTPKPRPRHSNGDAVDGLWQDEDVLAWVRKRMAARRLRDEIMVESKEGQHDWPIADRHLPQNAVDRCIAIIKDRDRVGRNGAPSKSGATAKMRAYATARKKDPGKLWDLRYNLMKLVGWLAQLDLLDWGIDQWEREGIYDLYDDLVLLDEWTTRALARAAAYIDDDGIREKIRKMRENQSGRTEAEKENIKRRVKALERRLESKLTA